MTDRNRYTLRRSQPDEPATYTEMASEHEQTFAKTLGVHDATEVPSGPPDYPKQPADGPWGANGVDRNIEPPLGYSVDDVEDVSRVYQTHFDTPPQTDEPRPISVTPQAILATLATLGANDVAAEEGINTFWQMLAGLARLTQEHRTLAGVKAEIKKAKAELDAIRAKLAAVASFKESLQQ